MDFETWTKSMGKNVCYFETASLNNRRSKGGLGEGEGELQAQSSILRLKGDG